MAITIYLLQNFTLPHSGHYQYLLSTNMCYYAFSQWTNAFLLLKDLSLWRIGLSSRLHSCLLWLCIAAFTLAFAPCVARQSISGASAWFAKCISTFTSAANLCEQIFRCWIEVCDDWVVTSIILLESIFLCI